VSPIFAIVPVLILTVILHGCAAIPLAALAGSALEAGGGVLVKTGTAYTAGGTAYRTFTLPLEDVHVAVLEAFRRADITVKKDEASADGQLMIGEATHRKVRIRLIPLTRALTQMDLVVKRNFLASDKATASELLQLTERVVAGKTISGAAPDAGTKHSFPR
jgi:hypothetical protein